MTGGEKKATRHCHEDTRGRFRTLRDSPNALKSRKAEGESGKNSLIGKGKDHYR